MLICVVQVGVVECVFLFLCKEYSMGKGEGVEFFLQK